MAPVHNRLIGFVLTLLKRTMLSHATLVSGPKMCTGTMYSGERYLSFDSNHPMNMYSASKHYMNGLGNTQMLHC